MNDLVPNTVLLNAPNHSILRVSVVVFLTGNLKHEVM